MYKFSRDINFTNSMDDSSLLVLGIRLALSIPENKVNVKKLGLMKYVSPKAFAYYILKPCMCTGFAKLKAQM